MNFLLNGIKRFFSFVALILFLFILIPFGAIAGTLVTRVYEAEVRE